MSIMPFPVGLDCSVRGREARREVNRKGFMVDLNGYALYHLSTSHREEHVFQV